MCPPSVGYRIRVIKGLIMYIIYVYMCHLSVRWVSYSSDQRRYNFTVERRRKSLCSVVVIK